MSVKREIDKIRRGVVQLQAARIQAARGFRAPMIYQVGTTPWEKATSSDGNQRPGRPTIWLPAIEEIE